MNESLLERFDKQGFVVARSVVPFREVEKLRRMFLLEIVNWGLPKKQFDEFHYTKAWFPTLREHVKFLADYIPAQFKQGEMCEPQILLHFPDEAEDYPLEPHQDQEPSWADGRKYTSIVGVALSEQYALNGCLHAWPFESDQLGSPDIVPMKPGDIVAFHPKLWHAGGLNHSGEIRMMVYFRYLETL